MCGNGKVSPVNLHGAQHELLTERSCFVSLWNTKLGRHLRSLSTLTCFIYVLSSGGFVKSFRKNMSDLSSQFMFYKLKLSSGVYLFFGTTLFMWVINSYQIYTSICLETVECHL